MATITVLSPVELLSAWVLPDEPAAEVSVDACPPPHAVQPAATAMERAKAKSFLFFIIKSSSCLDVLSESFLHLLLWPIFRQSHSNFRGGRNANASEIWAQLTKNLLTKSSTERFRENI